MDSSVLLQKQVKDNSEDLQSEFLDMKNWEEQMRRKDEQLRKEACGEAILPPIRSRAKKQPKVTETKQNESAAQPKRIKSHDYSSWDKFDVEKACQEVDKEEVSDQSEGEEMSKEELEKAHTAATKHKNEGNAFVQKQEWVKAIGCYNQAIKLFPYDAVFYANRALCQLKLDNLHSAESDCSAALQLDEAYVKAYHRRASARMGLKQYKEAKQDLDKILKIEPSNKEAKLLLAKVEKKIGSSKPLIISGEDSSNDVPIEKKIAEKLCPGLKEVVKKEEETESKVETMKDEDSYKRIPDWLPEKDNVAIIEPIKRPAHLRSNKAGVKIPVTEIPFETTKDINQAVKLTPDSKSNVEDKPIVEIKDTKTPITEKKVTEILQVVSEIPAVPKTAVQFLIHWKRNQSPEFRFKYLKQLTPGSIPAIFQESMESDIFSDILSILKTEFVPKGEPVFQYLEDLSKVKRFKALIMFISNKDKEGLRSLFDYCKESETVLDEKVQDLCKQYEL